MPHGLGLAGDPAFTRPDVGLDPPRQMKIVVAQPDVAVLHAVADAGVEDLLARRGRVDRVRRRQTRVDFGEPLPPGVAAEVVVRRIRHQVDAGVAQPGERVDGAVEVDQWHPVARMTRLQVVHGLRVFRRLDDVKETRPFGGGDVELPGHRRDTRRQVGHGDRVGAALEPGGSHCGQVARLTPPGGAGVVEGEPVLAAVGMGEKNRALTGRSGLR